jgi:hypothetical protein
MRRLAFSLFLLVLSVATVRADFVFETDLVRLVVDPRARALSLREESLGKEWLRRQPAPLFAVRKEDRWHPSTAMRKQGRKYLVDFGRADVTATYAITDHKDYIVFALLGIEGEDIQALRLLQLRTEGLKRAGRRLAVRWGDRFSINALALSPRVHAGLGRGNAIAATVYPELGVAGEKAALLAVPTEDLLDTIRVVERDFGLPSPDIEGQWAKASDAVRSSYLFIDLTGIRRRQV